MPIIGYPQIIRDLKKHTTAFVFDSGDDLGIDMMEIAAESHQRAIDGQMSPDGTAWTPLSPKYEIWKSTNFPGAPMAFLYGIMASPNEIFGDRMVATRRAEYTYGQTPDAQAEAEYFEEGDPSRNRPPRPFTGLDDVGVQLTDDRCLKHLDDHIS